MSYFLSAMGLNNFKVLGTLPGKESLSVSVLAHLYESTESFSCYSDVHISMGVRVIL